VGKTVKNATAIDDANVFGKVGTTGAQVAKALKGKKVSFSALTHHGILTGTRLCLPGTKANTFGMSHP
jgi:hypothetical protein